MYKELQQFQSAVTMKTIFHSPWSIFHFHLMKHFYSIIVINEYFVKQFHQTNGSQLCNPLYIHNSIITTIGWSIIATTVIDMNFRKCTTFQTISHKVIPTAFVIERSLTATSVIHQMSSDVGNMVTLGANY